MAVLMILYKAYIQKRMKIEQQGFDHVHVIQCVWEDQESDWKGLKGQRLSALKGPSDQFWVLQFISFDQTYWFITCFHIVCNRKSTFILS